jgi:hypothetical protein
MLNSRPPTARHRNLRDEVLDELVRELDRFPNRHAEANKVFGVHG